MENKYEHIVKRFGGKYSHPPGTPERPPLSEAELEQYERDLEYTLPTDYREFLRDYGGVPFNATFPVESGTGSNEGSVFMFFDVSPIEELTRNREPFPIEYAPGLTKVLQINEGVKEVHDPPRELLPIAIDMGGNQVYLALGGLQPGAVFRWMNWGDIHFVAHSFDEFMRSLRPSDE